MRHRYLLALVVVASSFAVASCGRPTPAPPAAPAAPQQGTDAVPADFQARIARFAPVDIVASLEPLPPQERQVLAKLVEAARITDALFLRQSWAGNEGMLLGLLGDESPVGRARLHYFLINKGPWSRLDGNEVFIAGAPAKPEGANYYPAGATRAEVEAWIAKLPEPDRQRATGFFTTIRRAPGGSFTLVPYSLEYQGELARMAGLLREAAALTAQPTLKRFLETRADALLTNDYYA